MRRRLTFVVLAWTIAAAGCERESGEPTPPPGQVGGAPETDAAPGSDLGAAARDAAGRLDVLVEQGKEKAVSAAREGLDTAKAGFERLKARASEIAAEHRPAFDRAVADIESQFETVRERIESLGNANGESWRGLADEVRTHLARLSESIGEALQRFGASQRPREDGAG